VALSDDVSRIAAAAAAHATAGERVGAVLAVETATGERIYLCAFTNADGGQAWLALTDAGDPVTSRASVREAASIAALVEVAEEAAERDTAEAPRVASLPYLDSLGADSSIAGALPAIEELAHDVEANYKVPLA
jgi:predicted small integral membrane protein